MATTNSIETVLPKESFFRTWLNCWPVAEPPKSYLLFSAMSMMGASLGRKVWFGQDFRALWPMLNLLLIGPSGIGKSTSIHLAKKHLMETLPKAEQPQFFGSTTQEKLHDDLRPQPHAILFASELANYFTKQKYMEGMIPYVTELLDYPDQLERRTKGGSVVTVLEPSVTILGGSTKEWLHDQLPDSAATGGFLARFLIVKEDHKGQRIPDPEAALTKNQKAELEKKRLGMYDEFYAIMHSHEGRIPFEDHGTSDIYANWYNTHQSPNGHLAPFAARSGEFILRLAMLTAMSCHRSEIKDADIKAALELYEYCFNKLQEVVVPMSASGKMLALVLDAIGEQGLSEVGLLKAMRSYCPAQEVQKLVASLLASKDIKVVDGKYIKL